MLHCTEQKQRRHVSHHVTNIFSFLCLSRALTAFIADSVSNAYEVARDKTCSLKSEGRFFEVGGLAFSLTRNSSWTQPISEGIFELQSKDQIAQIGSDWTINGCRKSEKAYSMGLDEFAGFLFNTAMCCVGCFLILVVEIAVYKITRRRKHFVFRPTTRTYLGLAGLKLQTDSSILDISQLDVSSTSI